MPTATPFNAIGAGNGFPSCLSKVDVSSYEYVNPMTLEQAMKFRWNSYSVEMSASYNPVGDPFNGNVSNPTVDDRIDNGTDENPSGYEVGDRDPAKRVCGSVGRSYETQDDGSPYYSVGVLFFATGSVERLYDGDTTDEDNFIGYGFNGRIADAYAGEDGAEYNTVGSKTMLFSYAELKSDPVFWWFEWSIMADPDTVTSVTLDGIPFIKAEWTNFIVGDETTSITGLDFYTY